MKLFIVTRWGSDDPPDYANRPDTNYLVRAKDYLEAVALAERELERLPHKRVSPFANVVTQLGSDCSTEHKSRVLAGPFMQHMYIGNSYQEAWIRDPQLEVTGWQTMQDRDKM